MTGIEMMRMTSGRLWIGGFALVAAAAGLSCQERGYRTEVYPGQQGQTEVRHVPVDAPAPTRAHQSVPTQRESTADTELNTVETLWPRLTPDDRQRVADLARRLAETQK
jgi:hypothetical protein